MARRLFFVPEVRSGFAAIRGEDARHLTRVLRVERGEVYQLSDNRNLYLASVASAHKEEVSFEILEKLPQPDAGSQITLAAAVIKFDAFEWMLEKATELGVTRIVPVVATRSEQGLERAIPKRLERWRRILLESSQQCRRPILPGIEDAVGLSAALGLEAEVRLFADEEGGSPLPDAVPSSAVSVAILIGPEGGWTAAEREAARGWRSISLSRNILRAETAAIAALAQLAARLL